MNRILILHVSVGMGHQRAAEALGRAFATIPDTTALIEDTLDYAHGWFRRGYAGAYLDIAGVSPELWSRYYARTDRPNRLMDGVRRLTTRLGVNGLAALIERTRPNAIVCTHFLAAEALALLPQRLPPIYSVVTDFHAHQFWACPGIDRHFVPTAATKDQLVTSGVNRHSIEVTGIPIDPAIATPTGQTAARRELGLPEDQPVVALIGSGLPIKQVRSLVVDLLADQLPRTVAVAAGRNGDLASALSGLGHDAAARLHVLGLQPSLAGLLSASDLVISKAGGLTVSEALAIGTPMVIPTSELIGQERWNAAHVIGAGAGVGCASMSDATDAVHSLLIDSHRLARMHAAARRIGRPNAATAIAARVLADIDQYTAPSYRPLGQPRNILAALSGSTR